jgi:hypothetical protein
MIKLTYRQLNQSWPGLQSLGENKLPPGAFKLNIVRILEQLSPEYDAYQKEYMALVLRYCTPADDYGEMFQKPKTEEGRQRFTEEVDELQNQEIEIRGRMITDEEILKHNIIFTAIEEIMLKKWLIEPSILETDVFEEVELKGETS